MKNVKEHFLCPINQDVMEEPVMAADGYTYERVVIEAWIRQRGNRAISPMTGERLAHLELQPNLLIKSMIAQYKDEKPSRREKKLTEADLEVAIRLREEELMAYLAKQQQKLDEVGQERDEVMGRLGPVAQENQRLREENTLLKLKGHVEMPLDDKVLSNQLNSLIASSQATEALIKNYSANVIKRAMASHGVHTLLKKTQLQKKQEDLSHALEQADRQHQKALNEAESAIGQEIQTKEAAKDRELKQINKGLIEATTHEDEQELLRLINVRGQIREQFDEDKTSLEKTLQETVTKKKSEHQRATEKTKEGLQQVKAAKEAKRRDIVARVKPIEHLTQVMAEQKKKLLRFSAEQKSQSTLLNQHIHEKTALLDTRLQRPTLVFSPPPKPAPSPKVAPEAIKQFLRLVAEGEQDQVEALLKKDRNLGLVYGDVTDLSERTFKNITGFQYAVWALDWHMWSMMEQYIPEEAIRTQLQGFESGEAFKQHGKSASWQNLVDALAEQVRLIEANKWYMSQTQWQRSVGGAQRLLPVHVVNEYCHPSRSFHPCPDFKAGPLPRTRQTDVGDWFTATYNDGKLGHKFAVIHGARSWGSAVPYGATQQGDGAEYHQKGVVPRVAVPFLTQDRHACHALLSTRSQQRDELLERYSDRQKAKASLF